MPPSGQKAPGAQSPHQTRNRPNPTSPRPAEDPHLQDRVPNLAALHLGPARYVDGAYARSIILNELTGAKRIYAVKPINDRWLGRLPQNLFEVADMQTEFWMEASYREQYRLIETINDLKSAGRLASKPTGQPDNGHVTGTEIESRIRRVSQKKYKDVELIPVEIAIQRGFFTYFVEDREVFRDAYGQSLQLLMRTRTTHGANEMKPVSHRSPRESPREVAPGMHVRILTRFWSPAPPDLVGRPASSMRGCGC